jgi:hypothetical protein
MLRQRTIPLLILTAVFWLLTALAHADFQAGKDDYDRGDYSIPQGEWTHLRKKVKIAGSITRFAVLMTPRQS